METDAHHILKKRSSEAIFCVFLLIIVITFAFYPSLHNGFTNRDDQDFVLSNVLIHRLSLENVAAMFNFSDFQSHHRVLVAKYLFIPLTLLTYAHEYSFAS